MLLFMSCGVGERSLKGVEILVDTGNNNIKINNKDINDFDLNKIESIIGEPDRIGIDTMLARYEEHGYGKYPSTSTMIEVINYYYVYDELGIMFYTNNGKEAIKKPKKLSIHFGNKRLFTNTRFLTFSPNDTFSGMLKINNEILDNNKKLIPDGVDYNTKEFQLFDIPFGPTSIGTKIDRLYSIDVNPYILLYLDTEESQRISYVEILNNNSIN